MGCLSSTRVAEIQAQIVMLNINLTAINTAINNGSLHIDTYSLDTGEGKQMIKYKSFESLFSARDLIQSQIDRLNRKLRGQGLVNVNVRRLG